MPLENSQGLSAFDSLCGVLIVFVLFLYWLFKRNHAGQYFAFVLILFYPIFSAVALWVEPHFNHMILLQDLERRTEKHSFLQYLRDHTPIEYQKNITASLAIAASKDLPAAKHFFQAASLEHSQHHTLKGLEAASDQQLTRYAKTYHDLLDSLITSPVMTCEEWHSKITKSDSHFLSLEMALLDSLYPLIEASSKTDFRRPSPVSYRDALEQLQLYIQDATTQTAAVPQEDRICHHQKILFAKILSSEQNRHIHLRYLLKPEATTQGQKP